MNAAYENFSEREIERLKTKSGGINNIFDFWESRGLKMPYINRKKHSQPEKNFCQSIHTEESYDKEEN